MGLFIGASILTVLELFDYAYEVSVCRPTAARGSRLSWSTEMFVWDMGKSRP